MNIVMRRLAPLFALLFPIALIFGFCTLTPATAHAQSATPYDGYTHVIARVGSVQLESHHLNCNPVALDRDPVWVNGWGWTMPRVGWWTLYPAAGVGMTEALMHVGVNDYVAAIASFAALEAIPTGRQGYLATRNGGVWHLNLFDKIGDIHGRLLPLLHVARQHHEHTRSEIGRWAAVEAVAECVKRP